MLEKNVTITPVHSHSVPKTTYLSTDCRFRLKIEVKIEGKIPYDEEKQLFCPQELQIPFWGFVKKKASEYGALQAEYKNKIMNLDSQQLEEVALGANWLNYLRQTYWMSYKTCKIGANVPLDKVDTMHYDERFVDHGLKETFRKVKASIKGSMGTRSAKQAESTRRSNEKRRKEKDFVLKPKPQIYASWPGETHKYVDDIYLPIVKAYELGVLKRCVSSYDELSVMNYSIPTSAFLSPHSKIKYNVTYSYQDIKGLQKFYGPGSIGPVIYILSDVSILSHILY
eukprot:Pgem_evm1s11584